MKHISFPVLKTANIWYNKNVLVMFQCKANMNGPVSNDECVLVYYFDHMHNPCNRKNTVVTLFLMIYKPKSFSCTTIKFKQVYSCLIMLVKFIFVLCLHCNCNKSDLYIIVLCHRFEEKTIHRARFVRPSVRPSVAKMIM